MNWKIWNETKGDPESTRKTTLGSNNDMTIDIYVGRGTKDSHLLGTIKVFSTVPTQVFIPGKGIKGGVNYPRRAFLSGFKLELFNNEDKLVNTMSMQRTLPYGLPVSKSVKFEPVQYKD